MLARSLWGVDPSGSGRCSWAEQSHQNSQRQREGKRWCLSTFFFVLFLLSKVLSPCMECCCPNSRWAFLCQNRLVWCSPIPQHIYINVTRNHKTPKLVISGEEEKDAGPWYPISHGLGRLVLMLYILRTQMCHDWSPS